MSQNVNRGLRLPGGYRITPLGIAALIVILLAIIILVVVSFLSGGGAEDVTAGSPTSTHTPAPTSTPPSLIIEPAKATPEPTLEPTPEPTPTPAPTPGIATIRFLGEISIDDNIILSAREPNGAYDFTDMLISVTGITSGADYTVANVEGPMGGIGGGYTGKTDYNTPEHLIANLADIGVDMLALSNDHALDTGFEGLMSAIANCEEAGMEYAGAAKSAAEKSVPKIVMLNGTNVCFLNYTSTFNLKEKNTNADALAYGANLIAASNAPADIAAARAAGADVVIVIMSWSKDGEEKVVQSQLEAAKQLASWGVDAIIGYGPRVIQPISKNTFTVDGKTKDVWCAFSLGALLTDASARGANCGMILDLTITPQSDGTFSIEPACIPTYVWRTKTDTGFDYRVLALGEWAEEKPEGMSHEEYQNMLNYWQLMPDRVGTAAPIKAN